MMDRSLSLDQAPPFKAIYPFFVMASVWGVIAGIILMGIGFDAFENGSLNVFALLHCVVLGMFFSVMIGALFQMSPVLVGIKINNSVIYSRVILLFLNVGVIILSVAFTTGEAHFFALASALFGALLLVVLWIFRSYFSRALNMATAKAMRYALISLLIGGSVGCSVAYSLSTQGVMVYLAPLHGVWMSYGWIMMLIMGVSYQVISMFYVTPPYPQKCTALMSPLMIGVIAMTFIVGLIGLFDYRWLTFLLDLMVIGWGVVTLKNIAHRKRKMIEPPLWFWIMGVTLLIIGSMAHTLLTLQNEDLKVVVLVVSLCGVWSIMQGMILKIIPFMTWFHLTNQGVEDAPMMRDLINPTSMKKLLWLWGGSAFLLISLSLHEQMYLAGGGLVISSLYFGIMITRTIWVYVTMNKERVC